MKRLTIALLLVVFTAGGLRGASAAPFLQDSRKPPEKVKEKPKPTPDRGSKDSRDDKKKDDRRKPYFLS
jgi:hypothetical protein